MKLPKACTNPFLQQSAAVCRSHRKLGEQGVGENASFQGVILRTVFTVCIFAAAASRTEYGQARAGGMLQPHPWAGLRGAPSAHVIQLRGRKLIPPAHGCHVVFNCVIMLFPSAGMAVRRLRGPPWNCIKILTVRLLKAGVQVSFSILATSYRTSIMPEIAD